MSGHGSIKRLFAIILLCAVAVSFSSCVGRDFVADELTVTLDMFFFKVEVEREDVLLCLANTDGLTVIIMKDEFEYLEGTGLSESSTPFEYAGRLCDGADEVYEEAKALEGGAARYAYVKEVDGDRLIYSVYCYRSSTGFYTVHFAAEEDRFTKLTKKIEEYAATVRVE